MIISHRYQFIFVKTVKTAGTSIEAYLNAFLGPEDVATPIYPPIEGVFGKNHEGFFNPIPEVMARGVRALPGAGRDQVRRRRYYNHLPAYKIRARAGADLWNRYYTFAVERNPWDKTVSYYSMKAARSETPLSWGDFVKGNEHCRNLLHYVEPRRPSTIIVDRVVRYEHLDDELLEVFRQLGIPFEGTLGEKAKSQYRVDRRPYADWYDEAQRLRIGEVFADEISLHGYRFGEG